MATKFDVGHNASILCMDTTEDVGASGDEDGVVQLWTQTGEKTNSVQIGSESVNSVKFAQSKPELLAASGTTIHQLDLRYLPNRLHIFDVNQDEINQVDLNPKDEYIAACDDSGHIKIIHVLDKKVHKTLRKHDNICTTVCFRPNMSSELMSGALDCGVIRWDFLRGKCIKHFVMNTMTDDNENVQSYVVSPPFVHTSSINFDGAFYACGLENGTIQVFDTSKKTVSHSKTYKGHSRGVSQVHYVAGKSSLLVSGGNDGNLMVWDITKPSCNTNAIIGESEGATAASACLQVKEHGEKINWLSSWTNKDRTLLVADQTNIIHCYDLA